MSYSQNSKITHNIYRKVIYRKGGFLMSSYIIEGGRKLEGELNVSGSKNASLPIIAATILSGRTSKLYNVPNIHDTKITLEILRILGCKVDRKNGKITVDSKDVKNQKIPDNLMRQMRSSVVLAGALIGRFKRAIFSYPGGCDIGTRPIDLHLQGFKKLGINITEEAGYIICKCDKIIGAEINLDFPSVGATENIIMAAVLAEGKTVITNAAMEPEIVDLQNFLNRMGAKISGAGTSKITIKGVKTLKDVSYNIMPDRIEAGTLLCIVASTGGKLKLNNIIAEQISPIINKLKECGCKIQVNKKNLILEAPKKLKAIDVKTTPYPGFPTDMQSVFGAMLLTAKGTSIITENIFENRYKYLNEAKRMGAKSTIEGKTAVIKGVKKLYGTNVEATDLRGGAAMVLARNKCKGENNNK
jgi:UDP-N-acetylglucosamine 1-carboxyvinyltransferase